MSANEQAPKWVWIWTDEPYQWHTTKSAESDVKYVRYSDYEQLQSRLAQVEKERSDLQERLAEEIAKRVNENSEKAERPIPPRTWPKPWWG